MGNRQQMMRAMRRRRTLFEEQFWPVLAALSVLCIFLVATVSAYLRVDDPRWYANAWTWAVVLPIVTGLVTIALQPLRRGDTRRSFQLSVVLCLLLHAVLLVVSAETNIFGQFWKNADRVNQRDRPQEAPVEPDYPVLRSDQPQRSWELLQRPVETTTPESPATPTRQLRTEYPPSESRSLREAPEPEPQVTGNPLALSRLPAQRDRPQIDRRIAPLPRSEAEREPPPLEPVEIPALAAESSQHVLQASVSAPARPAAPPARRAAVGPAPSPPPLQRQPPRLARRTRPAQPDDEVERPIRLPRVRPNRQTPLRPPADTQIPETLWSAGHPAPSPPALEASREAAQLTQLPQPRQAPSRTRATIASVPRQLDPAAEGPAGRAEEALLPSLPNRRSFRPLPDALSGLADQAGSRRGADRRRVASLPTPAARPVDVAPAVAEETATTAPANRVVTAELSEAAPMSAADFPTRPPTPAGQPARFAGPSHQPPLLASNPRLPNRRRPPESRLGIAFPSDRPRRPRWAAQLPPTRNTPVLIPEPFERRSQRLGGESGVTDSPGPETEEAIELGLAFLARSQSADGSWSLDSFAPVALSTDTAATGLALLAFQGAGYHHREHRYAEVVAAGIQFLLERQRENGDLFRPMADNSNRSVWLYSHAIAALALNEAYGMTQDPDLRLPAQRGIDFIVMAQDKVYGGWRYTPGIGSDSSVSGWMVMALKSGQLAGLEVPEDCLLLSRQWFDRAQASAESPELYRYNPYAPNSPSQAHGRQPSPTMTAVGLLVRLYDGWRPHDARLLRGGAYLRNHVPAIGTPRAPLRDTYYWYYGTQVMYFLQGSYWQHWQAALRPLLLENQIKEGRWAGSWDPGGRVPDRWAAHAGRLYVTTLNLLSLEVQYRHLPLYRETENESAQPAAAEEHTR